MSNEESTKFLLEEYNMLKESFFKNEELGDRRVNLFLTITTAVIGSLGIVKFLPKFTETSEMYLVILILGTFSTLFFGILTFVRIIQRNKNTDDIKRKLDKIRRFFIDNDNSISKFLAYDPKSKPTHRIKGWSDIISPQKGGLAPTVMLINSLIISCFVGLIFFTSIGLESGNTDVYTNIGIGIAIITAFFISWLLHFSYMKKKYCPLESDLYFLIDDDYFSIPQSPSDVTNELKSRFDSVYSEPSVKDILSDFAKKDDLGIKLGKNGKYVINDSQNGTKNMTS